MENIKDGTAEFRVTDDRLFSILDLIYPVGRIIISNDSTAPYSDIGFGTWQEVAIPIPCSQRHMYHIIG